MMPRSTVLMGHFLYPIRCVAAEQNSCSIVMLCVCVCVCGVPHSFVVIASGFAATRSQVSVARVTSMAMALILTWTTAKLVTLSRTRSVMSFVFDETSA